MKKVILILIIFFVAAKFCQAAESDLIISEVMYDWPGSDSTHEWAEVYNAGSSLVEIIGTWRFFDGSNHILNLIQGSSTIAAGEFFIIADNVAQFFADYPNFVGTIFDTSLSLGNSGDDLALSADGGQNYFAQTNYSSDYGASGNGNSLEKINLSPDDSVANWHESLIAGGTPGQANSEVIDNPEILAPQVIITCPSSLVINEIGIFDASNSVDPQSLPLNFFWDFGDSTTSTSALAEHTFTATGNFSATITVSNGELTSADTCLVEVINNEEEGNDHEQSENDDGGGGADAPPLDSYLQISEFLPNPAGADTGEWIELYNSYFEPIDLTGYKLQDNSARIFTISEEDNLIISAQSYLVLAKGLTGISLNNTGGDAIKFYNPDDEEIEIISYGDTAPEGKSYAREGDTFLWSAAPTPGSVNQFLDNQPPIANIKLKSEKLAVNEKIILSAEPSTDPEEGELKFLWEFGDETTGDEKIENHVYPSAGNYLVKLTVADNEGEVGETTLLLNIIAEEADLALAEIQPINWQLNDLLITEFLPNPVGSDDNEWIELANNSAQEINLKGWQLDDADGGSKPYVFAEDFILSAQEYKIIDRQQDKLTLNNSEDSVRLLTPLGEIWQEVGYSKIPEGQSYAWDKFNQEWFVNNTPSPQQADFFVESLVSTNNISEISDLEKNSEVYVQGVALQDADQTSNVLYLADYVDGQVNFNQILEVYNSKKSWPEIKVGDVVDLYGKISRVSELPRVKISKADDILVINNEEGLTQPEIISPDDLSEDLLGDFITLKGWVTKKSGQNIYLSSNKEQESQIRVYAKLDLKDLEIKKDMEIVASGILSQTDSGYKLIVFKSEDILVPQILGIAMVAGEADNSLANTSSQINKLTGVAKQVGVKKVLWLILILSVVSGLIYYLKHKFS